MMISFNSVIFMLNNYITEHFWVLGIGIARDQ